MAFLSTRPVDPKIIIAMGLSGSFMAILIMFYTLGTIVAIAGSIVLLTVDMVMGWFFLKQFKKRDIGSENLETNILAKYKIQLSSIPDPRLDGEQPIYFTFENNAYTMSFYQDLKTFEPFIVQGSNPNTINPSTLEK